MNDQLHLSKNRFITEILQALHIKTDEFMYNLAHRNPYEILLYTWINKLFTKGKSCDEAIELIYKARNILFLKSTKAHCQEKIILNPVMSSLNNHLQN